MKLRVFLDQVMNETVLVNPVEGVLKPFADAAPFESARLWINTNLRNWLSKQPENLVQVRALPRTVTPQQAKAFEFNDLFEFRLSNHSKTLIDHVMDWFHGKARDAVTQRDQRIAQIRANGAEPTPEQLAKLDQMVADPIPRLERMTPDQVVKTADAEIAAYNKRAAKQAKNAEPETNYQVLMEFPGGYKMVEMLCQEALDREGNIMGHCVGSHHGGYLRDKTHRIFSLRGPDNQPHATLEVRTSSKKTTEIKGKKNAAPIRRYWPMIVEFFKKYEFKIDNDHRNVGMIQIGTDNGGYEIMSLQDFRDRIEAPGNTKGQKKIEAYLDNPGEFDHDQGMGLFDIIYSRGLINNRVIEYGARTFADHMVQTVQHYGNNMSPEQVGFMVVMISLNGRGDDKAKQTMVNDLVQTCTKSLNDMIGNIAGYENYTSSSGLGRYMLAVSMNRPDLYMQYIESDPDRLSKELEGKGTRASAPFFAFLRGDRRPTPMMIERAFEAEPEQAITALKKKAITSYSDADRVGALLGVSVHYATQYHPQKAKDKATEKILADIIEVMGLNKSSFDQACARMKEADQVKTRKFPLIFIRLVRLHDPKIVDPDTEVDALLAYNMADTYRDYLKSTDHPDVRIQQKIWGQIVKELEYGKQPSALLKLFKTFDPSIWDQTVRLLRVGPDPLDKTKAGEKNSYVHDRKAATKRFMMLLAAMLSNGHDVEDITEAAEPDLSDADDMSPTKYEEARAAFERAGRMKLFHQIMTRFNHEDAGRAFDKPVPYPPPQTREDQFASLLHRLDPVKIGNICLTGPKTLFMTLVAKSPERLVDVIRARLIKSHGRLEEVPVLWAHLDGSINKESALKAIDYVADAELPEKIRASFVFSMLVYYHPSPSKMVELMQMFPKANLHPGQIIKSLKEYPEEIVRMVANRYPWGHIVCLIPDKYWSVDDLVTVGRANWDGFHALMKSALRGFHDGEKGWQYGHELITSGPIFQKYEKAADRAGLREKFDRTILEWKHEQAHGGMGSRTGVVNHPLSIKGVTASIPPVETIAKHLDEYSMDSLSHFFNYSKDRARNKLISPETEEHVKWQQINAEISHLYYQRFSAKQLIKALRWPLFGETRSPANNLKDVAEIPSKKIGEMIDILSGPDFTDRYHGDLDKESSFLAEVLKMIDIDASTLNKLAKNSAFKKVIQASTQGDKISGGED